MGPLQEAEMLTPEGDVRADAWPAWIRAQAEANGWIGARGGVNTERIALDTGFAERTVERWLAGSLTPVLGVRRAIRRAWTAPIESRAMQGLIAALAPLQAAQRPSPHKGGGGADGSATRKDADRPAPSNAQAAPRGSPSPPSPSYDSTLWAFAEEQAAAIGASVEDTYQWLVQRAIKEAKG